MLEHVREVVIPIEPPILDSRRCDRCNNVLEFLVPDDRNELEMLDGAIEDARWAVVNGDLLCTFCSQGASDPREDRLRHSDILNDEMKDAEGEIE